MTSNNANNVTSISFKEEMKGKKNIEVAEILIARFEAQNALRPEELVWLDAFRKNVGCEGINEQNFKCTDGMSRIMKTLCVTGDAALYVWSLMVRFFQMLLRAVKSAWTRTFGRLFAKKTQPVEFKAVKGSPVTSAPDGKVHLSAEEFAMLSAQVA